MLRHSNVCRAISSATTFSLRWTLSLTDELLEEAKSPNLAASARLPLFPRVAAVAALLFSVYLAIRYSGQPILEAHGFRQTQTALTSYWLCRNGFSLAYETPSAGYPWTIPFEVPIFQAIVSFISCAFGFSLERIGRLMSYAFLLACLVPTAQIYRTIFRSSWQLYFTLFVPLFLLSPLYLFWGRTFMIETAALFFVLCFVQLALPYMLSQPTWRDAILTSLFLALAILQKSTTALPVWLIVLAFLALRACPTFAERVWRLLSPKMIVGFYFPFLLGVAWTKYTDVLKEQNVAGHRLTSTGLADWNFGPLSLRVSPEFWIHAIWNRVLNQNVGGIVGIGLIVAVLLLVSRTRVRLFILLALAAFVLPLLLFAKLHLIHNYYQSANLVFLLMAAATSIGALTEAYPRRRSVLQATFAFILVSDLFFFQLGGYWPLERLAITSANSRALALSDVLRTQTPPDMPVIIYGLDWSSEVPFYSQRRALGVPVWFTPQQQLDIIAHPAAYVHEQPSAIVLCGTQFQGLKSLVHAGLQTRHTIIVSGCEMNLTR